MAESCQAEQVAHGRAGTREAAKKLYGRAVCSLRARLGAEGKNPPEHHEAMLENLRLHREIVAAAAAAGS